MSSHSPSPDASTGYPFYPHLSANSGSLHNNAIRSLSLHMQYGLAHTVLGRLNKLKLYDHQRFLDALQRPRDQALITVANHHSTIDDPVVLAAMTPYKTMTDIHAARWGWCARELCFPNKFTGWFFLHGKIFPIIRGLGLSQQGVREADEHIARGEWMHVFSEGKCIPVTSGIGPLRWGIGKLVADAYARTRRCAEAKRAWEDFLAAAAAAGTPEHPASFAVASSSPAATTVSPSITHLASPPAGACPPLPLVVPFVHHGMTRVMPFYHRIPKTGHTVRCMTGEAIDFTDLVDHHERNVHNRHAFDYPLESDLYVAITDRVYERLAQLDRALLQIEHDEGEPQPPSPERI